LETLTPEVVIKTKNLFIIIVLATVACLFIGCAHPNPHKGFANASQGVAGFIAGIGHGFVCVFALLASLFSERYTIYEVYNTGVGYNFGFLIGQLLFLSMATISGLMFWIWLNAATKDLIRVEQSREDMDSEETS
jgi:Na+-translocating ferredoxin:NAD+ oxidoreductase RnfA subunit